MLSRTSHRFPAILLGLYSVVFFFLAINPIDRQTWFVENITVIIIVGTLLVLYALRVRFSSTAYALMAVLIFLHTIGGHYTFEKVPFDWVTNYFGFARNHFDRVAHFSVGFYAFTVAEWLLAKRLVANRFLLFTYPVFVIATIAMSYELIEWIYAANADPLAGAAYLGSQGDIWDAQKDMLADTLGAIMGTIFFFWVQGFRRLRTLLSQTS
ncbi:MAG: putative membrane protein [Parcubacteria group bacterium GW2011_GWA2_47_7]|nr:MAG: putative membrane protein [Parcubacteria group bacterium GW2011_GWA2_47_7]